jgi:hypothetical protein
MIRNPIVTIVIAFTVISGSFSSRYLVENSMSAGMALLSNFSPCKATPFHLPRDRFASFNIFCVAYQPVNIAIGTPAGEYAHCPA